MGQATNHKRNVTI